jgi:hypothetical protein
MFLSHLAQQKTSAQGIKNFLKTKAYIRSGMPMPSICPHARMASPV